MNKIKLTHYLKSALRHLALLPVDILCITAGVVADVVSLGGAVNDGWFKNGRRTYTTKALHGVARAHLSKRL